MDDVIEAQANLNEIKVTLMILREITVEMTKSKKEEIGLGDLLMKIRQRLRENNA